MITLFRLSSCAMFLALACLPTQALAFKIDVHIWIAQQVLNDIQDGDIDLKIGNQSRSLRINDRYLQALRHHPKQFLKGSLGPDAFPEVLVGQMAIHPSITSGWGTSDWLQHLLNDPNLSDEELAFALGYLTHASADVFAHTFVNRYAGDLFELEDHEWAAIRHIHIESFVSNYLPPLFSGGRSILPIDAVKTNGRIEIPSSLLLRKFFLNKTAIDQFKLSGSAPHLTAVFDLHRNLEDFLSEDGLLFDLEAMTLQLVGEATVGIPIAHEQARKIQELSHKVRNEFNNVSEDIGKFAQDVNNELGRIEGLRNEIIAKGMTEALNLGNEYIKVQDKIAREGLELLELQQTLAALPTEILVEVCEDLPWPLDELCGWVRRANPQRALVQLAIDQVRDLLDKLGEERERLLHKTKEAIQAGLEVVQAELQARIDLTNAFIAFAANKPFSAPFRKEIETWKDNIPVVLSEFSRANAQAMLNTIDPSRPGITEPLKRWFICYGPGLAAVPTKVTSGICVVWNGVDQVRKEIDEFEATVAAMTPITDGIYRTKRDVMEKVEKLKIELIQKGTIEVLGQFDLVANSQTKHIYKGLETHVGIGELNDVMSRDNSGQGLLIVPDAGQRIRAEMKITNGHFNAETFFPVRNAVVLSKLAMLDRAGLVELAKIAQLAHTRFGPHLYNDGDPVSANILFGFVQNIDGNHQWHDLSPPHPRTDGFDGVDFDKRAADPDARYGYSDDKCQRRLGMRLWADASAREKLFRKLFRGKLAAGIDDPASLDPAFAPVLHSTYPDLFKGGEWDEDGLTLVKNTVVSNFSLKVEDYNAKAKTLELFADDMPISQAAYDDGLLSHSFNIGIGQSPVRLRAVSKDSKSRVLASLVMELGCDGITRETLISQRAFVEVQPGDSLWRLSRNLTGQGILYSELHLANANQIRHQDLIYPGQVFVVPWPTTVRLSVQ
ncbi:Hypothetical protein NGAL_HAMBI1146_00390 [Neorhizobium galegae bv. officinalis]|nr:Hypothetical protein NGAL_HAMBI1146_00390 [Neorhizobium galegae bv. officinalis]